MIVLSYEEKMKLAMAIRVCQNYFGWGCPDKHGFEDLHQKLGPFLTVDQEVVFRAPYSFEQSTDDPNPPEFMLGRRAVIVSFDPMKSKEVKVRLIPTPGKGTHPTDGEERTVRISWVRPVDITDMSLDEIYDLEAKHGCAVGRR